MESPEILPDMNQQDPSEEPPQVESQDKLNGGDPFNPPDPSDGETDLGKGGSDNGPAIPPPNETEEGKPDDPSMKDHSTDQLM
jgi:hypothetical protein